MNIEVRLFATLRDYLPADRASPVLWLDVAQGASIADVLATLNIPPAEVGLTIVNGSYVGDRAQQLKEGAVLSLWSHVAGG